MAKKIPMSRVIAEADLDHNLQTADDWLMRKKKNRNQNSHGWPAHWLEERWENNTY